GLGEGWAILGMKRAPSVFVQIPPRYFVRRRAPHYVQRDRNVVSAPSGQELLQNDLKQRSIRERPQRKQALGLIEAQPRAQAAGHENHSHLARTENLGSNGASGFRTEAHAPAI